MNMGMDGAWGHWVNMDRRENRHVSRCRTTSSSPADGFSWKNCASSRSPAATPGQNQQGDLLPRACSTPSSAADVQELRRVSPPQHQQGVRQAIADPLTQRISGDENLHRECFYATSLPRAWTSPPAGDGVAFTAVLDNFRMPGSPCPSSAARPSSSPSAVMWRDADPLKHRDAVLVAHLQA